MFRRIRSIGLILVLLSTTAFAEEIKQKAPIVVNGDKVEYFHEEKKVIGTGNISIDYEDVKLTCKQVTVYLDTREAIAEGDVKITQKDTYITGERVNYNFDTRTGRAIDAYVNYVPFYGKSKDVQKVSENQTNIERGYITTCDLDKPHYRVQARQVRIYANDKVVAKHILFFVGNVPILYLPYYVQPLKDRSSGITTMLGHDSDWGYYALNSMKFDYSEIFKGRWRADYRTKNGLAFGVDDNYTLPGLGKGALRFYYTHENDSLSYEPETREENKYRLQVRHEWEINEDTTATLELNKVRDDNFMKYYFEKEWEEQGQPDNYFSIITAKEDYTTTFLTRVRLDKYYEVVQRLPEYSIDIPQYNIKYNGKDSPLYYNMNTSFVYLQKTFRNDSSIGPMKKDLDVLRLDTYNKLNYTMKLFKALSVTPYAGTRQTFYSRDAFGGTNLMRGVFTAGVDNSIKFYKVYNVNTNVLDLNINKLRHVVTPIVNYYYTHRPTIGPDNLMQFDEIDRIRDENGVLLSLENKLQTKRNGVSVDLVDFIISTNCQVKPYKDVFPTLDDSDYYDEEKFKTIDMQLELTPYPWLYSLAKMKIDRKKGLPDWASVDFVGGKEVDRSLAFGYRYERSFDPDVVADPDTNSSILSYLTADLIYRFNEFWKARIYWRANLDKGYIDEQEYTIYRDLHCWTLEFTYDIRPYQDNSTITDQIFWFALRLKAFPDQPLGIRRSYSRTRAGEPGDAGFRESQSVGFSR